MKKLVLSIVVVVVLLPQLFAQTTLPNTKIYNDLNRAIETQELVDGQTPFILSFWSTSCKPCILELDALCENYEEWSEESAFRIVAVSIDDSRSSARAKSLAQGRGWGEFFTLGFDINSDFKRTLNVVSVPQVFIFDKDGVMVYSHTGYTPGNEI